MAMTQGDLPSLKVDSPMIHESRKATARRRVTTLAYHSGWAFPRCDERNGFLHICFDSSKARAANVVQGIMAMVVYEGSTR